MVFLNTKALTIKLPNCMDLDEAQHILDASKSSIIAHPCTAWLHILFCLLQSHTSRSEGERGAKHRFPCVRCSCKLCSELHRLFCNYCSSTTNNPLPLVLPKTSKKLLFVINFILPHCFFSAEPHASDISISES